MSFGSVFRFPSCVGSRGDGGKEGVGVRANGCLQGGAYQ